MNQISLDEWATALGMRVAALCPAYFDDILQEARIAFWLAQRSYDASRSQAYEEFIKRRTRQHLFHELKKYRRWSQHEICADWVER